MYFLPEVPSADHPANPGAALARFLSWSAPCDTHWAGSRSDSTTDCPRALGDDLVLFVEPASFDADRVTREIVIPADVKLGVRDDLDHANITERVLFPGLDGLSLWLIRSYAPRG